VFAGERQQDSEFSQTATRNCLRRLQEMVKHGYVERVGNAYRVTDKVNVPDLKNKLQRRIDMIVDTARKLSELSETN
jgi:DNA-binding IclR family transcriptional regulator